MTFDVPLPAGARVTGARLRLFTVTRRARSGFRVLGRGGRQVGRRRRGWSRRGYKWARLRRDAVPGAGRIALEVVTRSRARKVFHAREGRRDPRLVVTYTTAARRPPAPAPQPVTFADEFDGAAGTPPNPAVWKLKTGGRWMNGGTAELQCYTRRPENVGHDGLGHLIITARYEPGSTYCVDGPNDYTSARLDTRGLQTFRYGRIEARIKLPTAAGSWPAWWMVGATGASPSAGEIDILEYRPGPAPAKAHHAIHADTASGGRWQQNTDVVGPWTSGWHTYGIEWRRDRIVFLIDGTPTWTRTRATAPEDANWRFNQPFGLLLNVAVGNWGGTPDPAQFPAQMLVDWVRTAPL